ncbi:MAG: efflux RND transporter periplasmic adaptor subunit [Acidobacteria bacterium]|nr:efflux RND transporter periplasmic adaptor subunit [Acidobacteriota bacterium]
MMKFKIGSGKRNLLIGLVIIAAALTSGYLYYQSKNSVEEYLTGKIEKGSIRNTVAATGTLQAVTTVQVGSQVSGNIEELYADFNSEVKKGQLVAKLDPSLFQTQVSQQRANLEQAKANLGNAEARQLAAEAEIRAQNLGVTGATANVEALKAQMDDAARMLERQRALAKSGIIPERDLESSQASLNTAQARYNQSKAQLEQARVNEQTAAKAGYAQAKAQVQQAKAQVQQAQASVNTSEVNLSHTLIYSPIDGVVVSRNVDKGQTVAASLSAPTLFTIANDLTQMQVIASIDQADIGSINPNNRVTFTVDAFPGENFYSSINQIRLNAQNVQNVVTYNVVLDVRNPERKLKPGMTANLTFTIAERTDVLRIPNAALRFRPADVTPEKIREFMKEAQAANPAMARRRPDSQTSPSPQGSEQTKGSDPNRPRGDGQGRRRVREQQTDSSSQGQGQGREMRRGGGDQVASQGQEQGGERRRWRNQQDGSTGQEQGRGMRRGGGDQAASQGNEQGGEGRRRRDQQGGGSGPSPDGGPRFTGFSTSTAAIEGQWRIVWVPGPDKKPQKRFILLGITDGSFTEILQGDLKEGEVIIVGQNITSENRPQNRQNPPGFGGPGGGGRGGFGGGGGGGGGRR